MNISAPTLPGQCAPTVSAPDTDKVATLQKQASFVQKQVTDEAKKCEDEQTKATKTAELNAKLAAIQAQIQQLEAAKQSPQVQSTPATDKNGSTDDASKIQPSQNYALGSSTDGTGRYLNVFA